MILVSFNKMVMITKVKTPYINLDEKMVPNLNQTINAVY